jgi:hypothetical protein
MANFIRLLRVVFWLWCFTAITVISACKIQVPAAVSTNFQKTKNENKQRKTKILNYPHDLSGHVQSPAFLLNGLDTFLLELDMGNSRFPLKLQFKLVLKSIFFDES